MTIGARDGCRAQRSRLRAYIDGDAGGLERLAFERHAEDCAPCADALRFALELERELHRLDGSDFDRGFEDRIVAGVAARLDAATAAMPAAAARAPTRRPLRWKPLVTAAAAIVVGFAFFARSTHEPSAEPTQIASLASNPATSIEDRVDPERLAATKRAFANALLRCASAPDLAHSYADATADFKRSGWPVDALLVAAIDDPADDVARAAVRVSAATRQDAALPALWRADRRAALHVDVTRALGPVADVAAVRQLEHRLDDPALWPAAIDALALCDRPDVVRVLATAARATTNLERAAAARRALIGKGDAGARALLELAVDGDGDAARVLGSERVVDDRLVLALLAAPRDVDLALCALDTLPEAAAIPLVVAHRAEFRAALGDAAFRAAVVDRVRQSADVTHLACAAVRADPRVAAAWIELLALAEPHGVAALRALFADASLAAAARAEAAVALASMNRLDARAALDVALATLTADPQAAATLLCCAVRAGHTDTALPGLAPKAAHDSLRTARIAAERWKADGQPPQACERNRIVEQLVQAAPRL